MIRLLPLSKPLGAVRSSLRPRLFGEFKRSIASSALRKNSAVTSEPLNTTATPEIGLGDKIIEILPEVSSAAIKIGDLKAYDLCHWTPVGLVQSFLEAATATTHLPFWATITLTTVSFRLLLLPLAVRTQRQSAILQRIKPEMDAIGAQLTRARKDQDTVAVAQNAQKLKQLLDQHKAKPLSLFTMPLVQAPLMLSFFLALRKMSEANLPWFEHGGMLWFENLNIADPTYALPVLAGVGFLGIFEVF